MNIKFVESHDSILLNGLAFFGKKGKLMRIISVRQYIPRKNTFKKRIILIEMHPFHVKSKKLNYRKFLFFSMNEIGSMKCNRAKITYQFPNAKALSRRLFTVLISPPEELVLVF